MLATPRRAREAVQELHHYEQYRDLSSQGSFEGGSHDGPAKTRRDAPSKKALAHMLESIMWYSSVSMTLCRAQLSSSDEGRDDREIMMV